MHSNKHEFVLLMPTYIIRLPFPMAGVAAAMIGLAYSTAP
jgi:hypothetical protein